MAAATCWRRPISCSPPASCCCRSRPASSGLRWPGPCIGIGMGFGLYEAAFATVAGLYGREARNAITGITLFAGFASTVGWPASAFFIDAFGWRGACLAWAALHLLIGLPLNRLLVPKAPPHRAGRRSRMEHRVRRAVDDDRAGLPCSARPGSSRRPWRRICRGCWKRSARRRRRRSSPASLVGPAQVAARLIEFSLLRQAVADDLGAPGDRPASDRRGAAGDRSGRWRRCPSCCCMAAATAC